MRRVSLYIGSPRADSVGSFPTLSTNESSVAVSRTRRSAPFAARRKTAKRSRAGVGCAVPEISPPPKKIMLPEPPPMLSELVWGVSLVVVGRLVAAGLVRADRFDVTAPPQPTSTTAASKIPNLGTEATTL